MLHIFEMKWFVLKYYYVLLFIWLDCFLLINTFPASSNPKENHGKNMRETLKKKKYPGFEEKIETSSVYCCSSVEDSDKNLPEEPPKVAKVDEMNLPYEIPNEELIYMMERFASTAIPPATTKHKSNSLFIYPGTKWCGAGNIADDYDDLGTEIETDKCCRIHDCCEDYISGGETNMKFNLTNKSSFTSLSCECDEQLYECLRRANTQTSNTVGSLYFNVFSRKCFLLDHPKKCTKYVTKTKKTGPLKICAQYEPDTLQEKIYQWTSPKKYQML